MVMNIDRSCGKLFKKSLYCSSLYTTRFAIPSGNVSAVNSLTSSVCRYYSIRRAVQIILPAQQSLTISPYTTFLNCQPYELIFINRLGLQCRRYSASEKKPETASESDEKVENEPCTADPPVENDKAGDQSSPPSNLKENNETNVINKRIKGRHTSPFSRLKNRRLRKAVSEILEDKSDDGVGENSVKPGTPIPQFHSVFALALYRRPAFPGFYQVLQIGEQDVLDFLIKIKDKGDGYIGGFMSKSERVPDSATFAENVALRKDAGKTPNISDLHETGTLLSIVNVNLHSHAKGGQVIVMPHRRIRRILSNLEESPKQSIDETSGDISVDSDNAISQSLPGLNEATSSQSNDEVISDEELKQDPNDEILNENLKDPRNSVLRHRSRGPGSHIRSINSSISKALNLQLDQPEQFDRRNHSSIGETTRILQSARNEHQSPQPASSFTQTLPTSFQGSIVFRSDSQSIIASDSTGGIDDPMSSNGDDAAALPSVLVTHHDDDLSIRFDSTDELKALHLEIVATVKELLTTSYFYKEHFDQVVKYYNLDFPSKLTDLVAGMSFAKRDEVQAVLHELDIPRRMWLVLEIVKTDLEVSKIQNRVRVEVEEKLTKEQKKYVLNEQLKYIKKELGLEKDEKQSIIQSFKAAIDGRTIPEEAAKVIDHEISRLSSLDPSSVEFNICRTYLECLTQLPWDITTTDNQDIDKAAEILDADHYGLQDVKDRLLEFMAVNILKTGAQGKIICLVGPPGVGKTSIGKSIARALDRKFYRFSLGGLHDVAELRGHRRTYVSAMPGKFIQALKHTQASNPVILLDEIDKLGKDFRGDPASALLEILDPQQNNTFRDHYLDIPVDLSKVLFICTANATDSIPLPLLDRMETVRLAGYVKEEKLAIASQYLIPQVMKETGVDNEKIDIKHSVLEKLVKDYSREAGVRSLLKHIEKIFRKVALQIVRKAIDRQTVELSNLTSYVGQAPFQSERLFAQTPPGVVMGLAWTQMGGATLFIEAQGRIMLPLHDTDSESSSSDEEDNIHPDSEEPSNDGENKIHKKKSPSKLSHRSSRSSSGGRSGQFRVTGQLGGVMNESCQIAMSFAKYFMSEFDQQNRYLDKAQIHLHIPEGATPKDGPSAGITMATSLISLALNEPVIPDLAMTGELTLTGKTIKIGGVKEKVIAARRENVKILVFPMDNLKDFEELNDNIKAGFVVHFVDCYDDLFNVAFPKFAISKEITVASKIPHRPPVTLRIPDAPEILTDATTTAKPNEIPDTTPATTPNEIPDATTATKPEEMSDSTINQKC